MKYVFVARNGIVATLLVFVSFLLSAPAPAETRAHAILVLGDSLSAAYGIPRERGWVALLQTKLLQTPLQTKPAQTNDARTKPVEQKASADLVINAGISGDTTDGGLARLPALLEKYKPDIALIELGANDGLRGFQIQRTRDNLAQIISLCQKANAKVLLIGMKIPPNYGLRYTTDFYETYTLAAKKFDVPLVPFLLDGVAGHSELMQEDGLHPRAEAQQKVLDNVWKYLKPML